MTDDLRPVPGVSGAAAETLLIKAVRCRRLARQSTDARAGEALTTLALECETKAAEIVGLLRRDF